MIGKEKVLYAEGSIKKHAENVPDNERTPSLLIT